MVWTYNKYSITFVALQDLTLILLLMDVPLQQQLINDIQEAFKSFNPCFNGCSSSTKRGEAYEAMWKRGFNPCFNGCSSSTSLIFLYSSDCNPVSILVLMDVPLQHCFFFFLGYNFRSFNPCFNGCSSSTLPLWS